MDQHLLDVLLIAAGGAGGAVLRHLVGRVVGPQADGSVPWHTFAINASGAFAIGLLVVLAARLGWPSWWRPLLVVGILGGYTTFSAYSLEIVELALTGHLATAAGYAFGLLGVGVAACAAGVFIGRLVA